MNRTESKEYQAWVELRKRIATQTISKQNETEREKRDRIEKLKKDFSAFARYYFPHYIDSEFGWFHKEAAKKIAKDPNIFAILEWPREHAKSVFADVMVPMWLKARGELDGMMLASASYDKAAGLLGDIQAELMENQLYKEDFGEQFSLGDWQDGHFSTSDGVGFWAFGRGQSPRGTRNAAKRPNYGVIDDIDDAKIVKNDELVGEAVDWILGDFFGALSILGARLVVAGNRIHKKAILSHLVGDVEPDDPKREGVTHIKVFAIEDEKHNESNVSAPGARPAWKERYTLEVLNQKMIKMGYRNAMREFFHKHIPKGKVFKPEDLPWWMPLKYHQYDELITYNDPSFKDTKKNDFKAIVLVGRKGTKYTILDCFVRQAKVTDMVASHYDMHESVGDLVCRHYMEANFMQDTLLDGYEEEGKERGYQMPIRPDKRKKPDKFARIENLLPLFSRGMVGFNEEKKKNPDMQVLREQFLGFPNGHDDGPDAVEGAISLMQKKTRSSKVKPRSGGYSRNVSRG
jgi:predicted phage terminase large subunit-like protein